MSEIRSQAAPERDELVHLLAGAVLDNPGGIGTLPQHAADRIIAAGWSKPRTVNSAAELDALPELSVVLVGGQLAVQKDVQWFATAYDEPLTFGDDAWNAGVVVLFTPGDAG